MILYVSEPLRLDLLEGFLDGPAEIVYLVRKPADTVLEPLLLVALDRLVHGWKALEGEKVVSPANKRLEGTGSLEDLLTNACVKMATNTCLPFTHCT